jgi:hypothetical protein
MPTARRSERPQPRNSSTKRENANRCVPMRHTTGSASSAARRVASASAPAAIASAKMAASFLAARPSRETAAISATARGPSCAMQRSTAAAFSRVRVHSPA